MLKHRDAVRSRTDLVAGLPPVLQVTEATGGRIRIRILVTAADAPTLFDLRCHVREAMVTWMQRTMPDALPVQRVLVTEDGEPAARTHPPTEQDPGAGLFTGSVEAEERASAFTNAIPVIPTDEIGRAHV